MRKLAYLALLLAVLLAPSALTADVVTVPATGGSSTVTPAGSSGDVQYNNAGSLGAVSGINLTTGALTSLELGHATDTTLARNAAGQLNIEGVQALTQTNTMSGITGKTFGATSFSGTLTMNTTNLIAIGASTIGSLGQNTTHTPDTTIFYTGTTSEGFHIKQFGDAAHDAQNCHAGSSASAYPFLCMHGTAQDTTGWWDIGFNGTDAIYDVGSGVHNFQDQIRLPAGDGTTMALTFGASTRGIYADAGTDSLYFKSAGTILGRFDTGSFVSFDNWQLGTIPKTADYVTVRDDTASLLTNEGATGTVIFTYFNNPWRGMHNKFAVVAAFTLTVQASAGEQLYLNGVAVTTISSSTVSDMLECWVTTDGSGAKIACADLGTGWSST